MKALPVILALAAMAAIWSTDLARILGAHPWWSGKVVLVGTPIGLALSGLAARLPGRAWQVGLFALATPAAFAIATAGKARFVASYAENHIAGQLWFIGWIATMAALAGLFLALAAALRDSGPKSAA